MFLWGRSPFFFLSFFHAKRVVHVCVFFVRFATKKKSTHIPFSALFVSSACVVLLSEQKRRRREEERCSKDDRKKKKRERLRDDDSRAGFSARTTTTWEE